MDLTKMSLEEFMCYAKSTLAPAAEDAFEVLQPALMGMTSSKLLDLGSGYAIHKFAGQPGDVLLVWNGEPVGVYIGEVLAIAAPHKGKGLSTPMILAAVVDRQPPVERKFSEAGKRSLEKAWRVANDPSARSRP